jgi:hypothetical protein
VVGRSRSASAGAVAGAGAGSGTTPVTIWQYVVVIIIIISMRLLAVWLREAQQNPREQCSNLPLSSTTRDLLLVFTIPREGGIVRMLIKIQNSLQDCLSSYSFYDSLSEFIQ